jgi:hydrogenase expression/formation protein HypE
MLKTGKLDSKILSDILKKLPQNREEILLGPGMGRDCCLIDFGDTICAMTTDPITGVSKNQGVLGVHVSLNDLAAYGAEPIGLLLTLMAPPNSVYASIESVINEAAAEAERMGLDILGGHTEVTDAVTRMVLSVTAIGRVAQERLVMPDKIEPGDRLVMTKTAGIEGTAILANECGSLLAEELGQACIDEARAFFDSISVLPESRIAVDMSARAMHDATEGGILGAAWEFAQAAGLGLHIYREHIAVAEPTRAFCEWLHIDPLKLISSGCMLIAVAESEPLINALNESGIPACDIGYFNQLGDKQVISHGDKRILTPPEADVLYEALDRCQQIV